MNIEDQAEELIEKYINLLEDVGTVPSEVRKEAIKCGLLCIETQENLLNRVQTNDGGVLYSELSNIAKYLKEI
jgi:hypothetical protein